MHITMATEQYQLAFERLKRINQCGQEYWLARQLAELLGYKQYRNFQAVIKKAQQACRNSGFNVNDHFHRFSKNISKGNGKKSRLTNIKLSRYACYLIIQNANPQLEVVAHAQTYFAIQSRRQELTVSAEMQENSMEEQSRLLLRNEIIQHNKRLAEAAKHAGIHDAADFSAFQNQGYSGLYGGLDRKQLHKNKGLAEQQHVLDNMSSTELAANLFRVTQTEEKLRRGNIHNKLHAFKTHHQIGQCIRELIAALGGMMPEDLPTPKKAISPLGKRLQKNAFDSIKQTAEAKRKRKGK